MSARTPLDVLESVVRVFEGLRIEYVVVGSFASSARGLARATGDVDLIADVRAEHAGPLASELSAEFYVDERSIRRAVETRRSFNVIHLESMFKVDVFIPGAVGFRREQLEHRRPEVISTDPERVVDIATAEDTILAKLQWYEEGGRASEQQWRDVLGVLRVQGEGLDVKYLRDKAAELGLRALLDDAMAESADGT